MKRLLLVESFFFIPSICNTLDRVHLSELAQSLQGVAFYTRFSSALEITPSVALISNSDCMQMP